MFVDKTPVLPLSVCINHLSFTIQSLVLMTLIGKTLKHQGMRKKMLLTSIFFSTFFPLSTQKISSFDQTFTCYLQFG